MMSDTAVILGIINSIEESAGFSHDGNPYVRGEGIGINVRQEPIHVENHRQNALTGGS